MEENNTPEISDKHNLQIQTEKQPTEPPVTEKQEIIKPKKNLKTPVLTTFFIILISILGYFIYQNYQLRKSVAGVTPTISTPSPASNPTAHWETYSNSDLSFKYPSDWKLTGNKITGNDPTVVINIIEKTSTLMNECMQLTQTETMDGIVLKRFSRIDSGVMCATENTDPRDIWIIPDENAYSPGISYNYSAQEQSEAEKTFNQILSTFKFSDQTETDQPVVTTPSAGSKLTSPVTIEGTVPAGWMNEGVFPIKLTGIDKVLIAQGQAKEVIPGSWTSGKPVGFKATLQFSTSAKSGFIVLEKDNPSGLPQNAKSFEIPINF